MLGFLCYNYNTERRKNYEVNVIHFLQKYTFYRYAKHGTF